MERSGDLKPSAADRKTLEKLIARPSAPAGHVRRARVVLLSVETIELVLLDENDRPVDHAAMRAAAIYGAWDIVGGVQTGFSASRDHATPPSASCSWSSRSRYRS